MAGKRKIYRDPLEEHLLWLHGCMPSEVLGANEKDFSKAPIAKFLEARYQRRKINGGKRRKTPV